MDGATMLMITIMAVTLGGVAAWHFVLSPRARQRRAIKRAHRVAIRQAGEGQVVKVVGRLRALEPEPLSAPLSGRPCVYHEVIVEQQVSSGKSSHWKTLIQRSECHREFAIDDGTGTIVVPATAATVVLHMDANFRSGVLNDPPPELEAFLARHGESSQGWVFNKTLRYREGVLEEGEQVAAVGVVRKEATLPGQNSGGGYRDTPYRKLLDLTAEGKLLVSDEPDLAR